MNLNSSLFACKRNVQSTSEKGLELYKKDSYKERVCVFFFFGGGGGAVYPSICLLIYQSISVNESIYLHLCRGLANEWKYNVRHIAQRKHLAW